jgi:hypothetical protein
MMSPLASRVLLAMLTTLMLAAAMLVFPLAESGRADATHSVDTEAEYRTALSDCEGLAASETCTIEFTSDIDMTTTGGSPAYAGVADLYLVGVGGQWEMLAATTDSLQFLYSGSDVEVTVDNLILSSFQWHNAGGAIGKVDGDLTIKNSRLVGSTALGGGAIYFSSVGTLKVVDSFVSFNTVSAGSTSGGAIYSSFGFVDIIRSEFLLNSVSNGQGGGAIGVHNNTVINVVDSSFIANNAVLGGAIYAGDAAAVTAENSTFFANDGGDGGGAVWAFEGAVDFTHVTSDDNAPGHVQVADVNGSFTTFGSVFNDDDVFDTCQIAGTATSLGYNWAPGAECWTTSAAGDVTDGEDAMLFGFEDNGGPTSTNRPHYASDLINAIPAGSCVLLTDQRGVERPQGGACDIGAVELVASFPDVPHDYVFAEEIYWLADSGITGGFDDGTFRPSANVTRQAMAAFLYRFADASFTAPVTPTFSDVPTTHPFYDEIEWLADSGISEGFDDGTFGPGANVTRQAMAAFLNRFAGVPYVPPPSPTFSDVPTSHAFYADVEWLASTSITTGFDDGTFRPGGKVTRQAMAAFLYRFAIFLDD